MFLFYHRKSNITSYKKQYYFVQIIVMTKSITDKKTAYTLAEQLDIVKEAYHEDGTTWVKQAAREFSVQP
jgi:hypothetical protein